MQAADATREGTRPITKLYAGLDVSKEKTALCVRDAEGRVVLEGKTLTDPDAITRELARCGGRVERVVLETGRMTNWLYRGCSPEGCRRSASTPGTRTRC